MTLLEILLIAAGLAMDAFAVSVAAGLTLADVTPRHTFRIAFHFGLFQFLMPVIGWVAGRQLAGVLAAYDHWIAFALLLIIGGKMLWESRHDAEIDKQSDPTRGWMLIMLSIATSIDALAVGTSLALMQHVSVWLPAVVIGLVAALFSALGIAFGARLGSRWSRWAQVVGGVILIFIGFRVLFSHLWGC